MNITIKYKSDFAFIKIGSNRFDYYNAEVIKDTLFEVIEEDTNKIILDLSSVDFMDSSGLSAIVKVFKYISSAGGELKICALLKQPYDLMKLLELDKILTLYSPKEFKAWKNRSQV